MILDDEIGINLVDALRMEPSTLRTFRIATGNDETSRIVMEYVLKGWPEVKRPS